MKINIVHENVIIKIEICQKVKIIEIEKVVFLLLMIEKTLINISNEDKMYLNEIIINVQNVVAKKR